MVTISARLAHEALDAAPDAMIIIDDSGAIHFANRQASVLFGYPHDDLIGRSVEQLMPERFRSVHSTHRRGYNTSPRFRSMGVGLQLFAQDSGGREFPVEISLSPVENDGRSLVAAAIRDVTERKRVEAELSAQVEELRRLRDMSTRLVETVDLPKMLEEVLEAAIALQRADFGNIQLRDPATSALKIVAQRGFSPVFLEHFASVGMDESSACARALRAGERVIIEDIDNDPGYLPHRSVAAHEGYRAVHSTPIWGRDRTVTGVLSTHFRHPHRPTDREMQLTDIYMRIASELIARVRDEEVVRAARDSANRANQAKSRFLATASHDLRQPLQALALLNGTLRRAVGDAAASELLAQQEQAIGVMSRLLNQLLDISKLESGAVKPDPGDFAVNALFEELRREFATPASNKGLGFKVTPCVDSAYSDPSLVGQILRNLVSNAIKYTREGWVALRCRREQAAFVRIEVSDTGVGIPDDQLRYIYDEFYQVGIPTNTTRDGYGLGLSIVQRIVTLLGLTLDVSSEVGKGSIFTLTLPAGQRAAQPMPRSETVGPVRAGESEVQVLLVEDDASVRNATRMLLKSDGYQVTAVAGLSEALSHVRGKARVDLLLTDYHLADGETGTQVINAVRQAVGQRVRAILVTGDTSSAIRELPRDPLMRVASKPVNAEELLRLLRELLASP